MRKFLSLCLVLFTLTTTPVSALSPHKKYKSCTELRKTYPNGVAKTRAAAKRTGAKYDPTVYAQNKSKDRDKDGVACEVSG